MCTKTGNDHGTTPSFVVLWEPDQDAIHVGSTTDEFTRNRQAFVRGEAYTTWLTLDTFATEAAARAFATQAQNLRNVRQARQQKELAS